MSVIFDNQICVFSGEKLKFKIMHEQELEFCLFQIIGEVFNKHLNLEPFNLKGVGHYYYHSDSTFYSSKPYMTESSNCKVSIIMPADLPPSYTQGHSFKIIYKLVIFFVYANDIYKQVQAPFIYFPTNCKELSTFDFEKGLYFQTLAYASQGIDSILSPTSPRKLVQMIDALRNPDEFENVMAEIDQDIFLDEIEQQVINSDSMFFYISNDNINICKVNIFKSGAILGRPVIGSIIALHDYCSNIEVSIETDERSKDNKISNKLWNTQVFEGVNQLKVIFAVHVPAQASSSFKSKQLELNWYLKVKVDVPVELSLEMEDEKSNDMVAIFTPHKRVLKSLHGRIPISVYPSKLHSLCLPNLYKIAQKL